MKHGKTETILDSKQLSQAIVAQYVAQMTLTQEVAGSNLMLSQCQCLSEDS